VDAIIRRASSQPLTARRAFVSDGVCMQEVKQRPGWVENRPSRGFRALDVRELWQYRELALFLALRDLKVRYKQAAFGAAWAILQPIAGVVVFTLVFRRLANMPSDGLPYPVFSYVGLSAWTYVSSGVTKTTQSLVANSALVTKVYFPRILAPLAAVLPGLLDFGLSLILLLVIMPFFGVTPTWAIVTTPLWLMAAVLVVVAVGLWLGTLNVSYRDVGQGIALAVQLWLFISPIAYPTSSIDGPLRWVYALNPVVAVVEGLRWALIGAPWPGDVVFVSLGVTVVVLAGGAAYFLRSERRFADVI
jgi:ABC-type polysaccharide/polyol phosphate export permease